MARVSTTRGCCERGGDADGAAVTLGEGLLVAAGLVAVTKTS